MKKLKRVLPVTLFLVFFIAGILFAYIPENNEENTYMERVEKPFFEVTQLIDDGIKAIRQEIVSSSYETNRTTNLSSRGVAEGESGKEEVTSKDVLYYEPKEEIYEAKEVIDEILIWSTMYRTTSPDDVVTYKKMMSCVKEKQKYLDKLIDALKYEKDNKDLVMQYKLKIKKIDKDYKTYKKRLKGKILLIENKPLPEPSPEQ
ncbi:MAG: hypothetical protein KA120_08425 [Candidatus Goldbacteria bacterium]|nr:hypothetical protein [Candidatus Goldiibacteriota bacterium]